MRAKTKVVCTIGPASWDKEVMKKMIDNGMVCARVNGAFANPEELDKVRDLVKSVSDKVSLMVDVKGPEVRMNKFAAPKQIKPGDEVVIGNDESAEIYPANYKDLYTYLSAGQRIVIGDGDVELKVVKIESDKMHCEVVFGEVLKPGKALNLPGAEYASDVLTEKDIENLKHAIATGWDFVSASFIKTAEAARLVNKHLEGSHMKLIAKIEDQEGLDNIDEILEEVEGIMVARGGLGVELGLEKVPMAQRYLIQKCKEAGKPVITATQMMESMITNPRPTRAEVNDVATAVLLGSDTVMLSGESSAGEYPSEAVAEMTKIAFEVEKHLIPEIVKTPAMGPATTDAISKAAAEMCINDHTIDKVIVVSRTGRTARLIGRHSIEQPIYVFTNHDYYARRMLLSKGITDAFVLNESLTDRDIAVERIVEMAKQNNIVKSGDRVMLVSKNPLNSELKFANIFEVVDIA